MIMCPKSTELNYLQKHIQCCLTDAVFKTIDEDSITSKVTKGLLKTQGDYKVLVDLAYPLITTRD